VLQDLGIHVFAGSRRQDFHIGQGLSHLAGELHSRLISVSQDVDNLVSKEWLSEVRLPGLNTRNPNGRNPAGVSSDGVNLSFADRDSVFALDDAIVLYIRGGSPGDDMYLP